jgi:hypothetical protein
VVRLNAQSWHEKSIEFGGSIGIDKFTNASFEIERQDRIEI